MNPPPIEISLEVNGTTRTCTVEPRTTLADCLRTCLALTGTHLGCEGGVQTVEGLAGTSGRLHPLQEAFRRHHGLQCGYCTPGMLMTALELLEENPNPTEGEVRVAISGNLCRCTGYQGIVASGLAAAAQLKEHGGAP